MNIQAIKEDIKANGECAEALYVATEAQIDKLIENGDIDEDFSHYAAVCREEMGCLTAQCLEEFGLQGLG